MSTVILGSGTFQDLFAPAKGKSEWGMDTLTRKLSGARSLLDAFIATLSQGDFYQGYYLQTWEPDDNSVVATIQLNYKGLLTGGTPLPDPQTEIVLATGRTSADYSDEGVPVGLGRLYRRDVYATAGEPGGGGPGDYGTSISFFRDRYAVSATMEFTYRAIQTRYRYITVGRPSSPSYTSIGFPGTSVIRDARIVLSDGTIYGRDQAATFDLEPVATEKVISFTSNNVIGTPYWEAVDIVRLELGNAEL